MSCMVDSRFAQVQKTPLGPPPAPTFVIRGGVEHQASALEASKVIDIFTPYREY